ncbi:helix-turn-helix transcriptional regulator [Shimia biformata]|uniref:helix-turn-helix transcriptional regulator n=1 Tax=Shimia biformata TaxID=1294299 RepID=UPI001EF2B8BC|nr:AraC family transcriptional regulator [Shimia biformata]
MQEIPDTGIRILTLAQMSMGEPWQLELLHRRKDHVFLWITRGQGRILLHGLRRGFGAHNAIFIPAGKLFALDMNRHVIGQAMVIPADGRVPLPERTQHLRLQDGFAQSELTGLLDAVRRELDEGKPHMGEALTAHATLISIWLRRQMELAEAEPARSAADRIVLKFCDQLSLQYGSDLTAADHADALGITPTHLARVCKARAGLSAADMISEVVQHEARRLLTRSHLPINEIARELGFGSAAYFTRFSQQHFARTPSQIRKAANVPSPTVAQHTH